MSRYILDFSDITLDDIPRVGGKNASLGEMFNALSPKGIGVVDGFATTASAYWDFLKTDDLGGKLTRLMDEFDSDDIIDLAARGAQARRLVKRTDLSGAFAREIIDARRRLEKRIGRSPRLAVRSSATAEDLPGASFAGQQETILNVTTDDELLDAVRTCISSLFTDRAINYRAEMGFDQMGVALSVGVQPMIEADHGSAGVIFTLDTETGFRDAVVITGAYGLGESVVQGSVTPDEWTVFKGTLRDRFTPVVGRTRGSKEFRLTRPATGTGTERIDTTPEERESYCLSDDEVVTLAKWACTIEDHYSKHAGHPQPMDIEWAKDGNSGELFVLQARPETVHSIKEIEAVARVYRLSGNTGTPLVTGSAVGSSIGSGPARVIKDQSQLGDVCAGEVLVATTTNPDWEPVMKRCAAIVTDAGGRTSHAAIVSREFGIPCIVGADNATQLIETGRTVTVSCSEGSEGKVYDGRVQFHVEEIDSSGRRPERTRILVNVADPSRAFEFSALPCDGVGLARVEFIINNTIGIHPMALVRYPDIADSDAVAQIRERIGGESPTEFFVRALSEGVGRIAAAFYPRQVIVRMSDFKTNEYAQLVGGAEFEPDEENPMLGFRGASRYYDPQYEEGFALECAAIARVRNRMGLTNLAAMIPFCRTAAEGKRVVDVMANHGLRQGDNGFLIYAMCELPSNALDADSFFDVFDGFSIGSNDLTQLTLGIDRGSGAVAHLFDERDIAVKRLISLAIEAAHRAGKPIGICGQAPSDFPEFAEWLVQQGITSISLNPDSVIMTSRRVADAEQQELNSTN